MKGLSQYHLWTAVVTPLDHTGQIDFDSFEKLLRAQEAASNGVVILGSTGEALNLAQSEREAIVSFTCSLQLKVPVMVGVQGHYLEGTLEWLNFLEGQNIQAYLMVTPIYAKPGEDGQRRWFEALLNQVSRPCMLYNVPSRAGVSLNLNAAKALSEHPLFWAVKEASGNAQAFSQYKGCLPKQKIYCGDDALMVEFAKLGACGLVSVAANAWPDATHLYVKKSLYTDDGQGLLPLWEQASQALFKASNPIPIKALLAHLRVIDSPLLRFPLSHWDYKHLAELISWHQEIQQWFQKETNETNETEQSPWTTVSSSTSSIN